MFSGIKLTTDGKRLNAYLIANNLPILFSKMKIGCGHTDELDRTDLVEKKMETEIEKVSAYGENNIFRATFTNQYLENGFDVREVGIFAKDENEQEILYAYDNAGNGQVDYFEAGTGNVILKEIFEIVSTFGNLSNIKLTINPKYVFVTEEEFKEHIDKDIVLSGCSLPASAFVNKEYLYPITGVTSEDLAIVWYKDTEAAADIAITADSVDGGILFKWEYAPSIIEDIEFSIEIKKVKK